jgi:farnesyl-diphosphate farnesyltransferase
MQSNERSTAPDLLTELLESVSRSFYLTLRVLPGAIRRQIGVAYLLARTTDTVADTDLVPVQDRLQALECLRRRIAGETRDPVSFHQLAGRQSDSAEQMLLRRCEESLSLLDRFPSEDQRLIRLVLATITSGQVLDLQRFALAGKDRLIALGNAAELDDYTYRVAGCVGEFWTRVCRAHLFPKARLDERALLEEGVRFGKGLQLVNILRDLAVDLRQGRCYLPEDELKKCGLGPADLLAAENEGRLRPLYDRYLARAEGDLTAGWAYTNRLPRTQVRLRLACAWPILIGLRTIELLRKNAVLNPAARVKVSRDEVKRIVTRSIVLYPFGKTWARQGQAAS